jgi:hypothetical protein
MQRRFLLLERRLVVLEQREHERQIRERFGATPSQFQSGSPLCNAAYFGDAGSAIGRQREDHSQAKAHSNLSDEPIEDRKIRDLHAQLDANDYSVYESRSLPNDFDEIRRSRSSEPIQVGRTGRIAAALNSFMVTAFLLGAILTVPAEKAAHVHALVNIAVNAISKAPHSK